MKRAYKVVDVFTGTALKGNPVAVVLDAEGLDTEAMQAYASWTNLSETTFVLPPTTDEADYRLRIFTPRSEFPFAGHPTLGSAHALLEAGRLTLRQGNRLVQECGVGLVELTVSDAVEGRRLTLGLPEARMTALSDADLADLDGILGGQLRKDVVPAIMDVGPKWAVAYIGSAASVIGLRPDFARLADFERRVGVVGLVVFGHHDGGDAAIEVRAFAPSCGVEEDPVCGSGNGSVAAFRWQRGLLPPEGCDYVAAQGQCVGRDGRVVVNVAAGGTIRIGGSCITCVDGILSL
jgi:PhzF family phenazine biosynthesis protein